MAKILLIEDDAVSRLMLTRVLEARGYTVIGATDGATGLVQVWSAHPDLILMDMQMPVFDGYAATRQLKGARETAKIPIIAVTSHNSPDEIARCLAAGCDAHEPKPVDFNSLTAKIQTLLARVPR
jgi:CheY-like chemotaxis protein